MQLNRRDFLKISAPVTAMLVLGRVPALTGLTQNPPTTSARTAGKAVLCDISRCIGCRNCEGACKRHNRLPAVRTEASPYWDNPQDLGSNTWTIVKFARLKTSAGVWRFAKWQCMHCVQPTCVAVCPTTALYKTEEGPVLYDESRCIGCQYCVIACPFSIPRFDWGKERVVRKCTMCADRIADGLEPACVEICPAGALSFGGHEVLIAEANKAEAEGAYVYGNDEVGGTSWIYISDVPFDQLGFPAVSTDSYPQHSKAILGSQIATIVAGAAALGFYSLYLRRKRMVI